MKVLCRRDGLLPALQLVSAAVATRDIKPVLRNIKATVAEDRCTLQATDLELGLRLEINGTAVEEPGEILLPAARTLAIMRETPDEELAVEAKNGTCYLRGQSSEFELCTEDPNKFPDVPTFTSDKYHETQASTLREMIRRTLFAVAAENTRYALTGVLWELQGEAACLVGTDGRRLAIAKGAATAHGDHPANGQHHVVPAKAMHLLERNLHDPDEQVCVSLGANEALFKTERVTIYTRLVEGRYPDYPFGWEPIGYWKTGQGGGRGTHVTVATPPSLAKDVIRPKEKALIELLRSEQANRRKTWVYVQFTDKHDVQGRLERLLEQAGFRVRVLRASVPLARREEWIVRYAPHLDAVISHPRLVETGLDLFDKAGRHNFPTICFYETGYNLFTLRQASRRSWRIGQRHPCRIVYFYYSATMQERAMALMGKKLTAAQALEGAFSSEGLVALAGEDANVEIALARSLVHRMDEGDARRLWSKVVNPCPVPQNGEPLLGSEPDSPESAEADLRFCLDAIGPRVDMPPFRQRRRQRVLTTCQADIPKRDGASSQQWLF